jgi:DNA-binding NarL/FixJ family response regulator
MSPHNRVVVSNFAQITASKRAKSTVCGPCVTQVRWPAKKHDRFYRGALQRERGLNSRWERIVPENSDGWFANRMVDLTLTRREAEVAELASRGLAGKLVARQLGVAEGTVRTHLHSIYRKLRVPNRNGLMQRAIANR